MNFRGQITDKELSFVNNFFLFSFQILILEATEEKEYNTLRMTRTADAFVVSCIDFRFQQYIRNWLDTNLAHKTFDYVGFAGGVKDLETIMKELDISVQLHDIKQVILMNHEECGAYGKESTPENHAGDLRKAKEVILAKYPYLSVDLYYLHLDGTFEPVN